MTTEVRNTWINYFQCKQGDLLTKIEKALSIGSKCYTDLLFLNAQISLLIDVLYRYVGEELEEDNCLTEEQLCSIICYMDKILKTQCNCN